MSAAFVVFECKNVIFQFRLWYKKPFDLVLVRLSIMMNFACLSKMCFVTWKCLHANMASSFLTSSRWLFSVILKVVSYFPTYCFLRKVHSIIQIRYALEQLTSWNIVRFICLLAFKSWWIITCLQQSVLLFIEHGEHSPFSLCCYVFSLCCTPFC